MKTFRAKKNWFDYLQEHCTGSSGFKGSLTGMRRGVWGNDAYVIKCCDYLFRVSKETFLFIIANS